MPRREATAVVISEELRPTLVAIARSRTASVRLVERSNIVLLAERGIANAAIARQLECTEDTVRKWRSRWSPLVGLASLDDASRSGRPAHVPPGDRAALIKLACNVPDNKSFRDEELKWRILGFIGRHNRVDAKPFKWKFRGTSIRRRERA